MKRKGIVRLFAIIMTGAMVIGMSGCDRRAKRVKYDWVERTGIGTEVTLKELNPQSIGRHFYTEETNYRFGFSGSGVAFGFSGDSLEVDFNGCGSYLAVYIDDEEEKVVVASEKGLVTVAEGLDKDKIHSVSIIRRSEGNGGEGSTYISKVRIAEGGKYYVKEYKEERKRIEVLGDSISCGWGNLYDGTEKSAAEMEDGSKTFATMLADYYDADLTTICISGIGVGNAANSPWPLLPVYKGNGGAPNDFTQNIPDVVIIELGTNDDACGNTGDEFSENAKEYIRFIRSNYPDATIIWYYGIMGETLKDRITDVVREFNDAGDKNVYALFTTQNPEEGMGGAGHPSMKTHERMAKELESFINKHVRW